VRNEQVIPPTDNTFVFNQWRKGDNYPQYVNTSYNTRYAGVSIDQYVAAELSAVPPHGAGSFQSNNSFPEGYRQSGGTCYAPGTSPSSLACASQPFQTYAQSSMDFLVPVASDGIQRATSITTDLYQAAALYLQGIDRYNTSRIQ
jgi:hypothetical protein